MHTIRTEEIDRGPEPFRTALAAMVRVGVTLARLVERAAEAEIALADAAVSVADGVEPVATSLAEAIEADKAASAAGEARHAVVGRTEVLVAAFSSVSRSVRRTIWLAERMDKGWARPCRADNREAMTRQRAARHTEDEAAERRHEALRERLDGLDGLDDIDGSAEVIIRAICRDLGLDAARLPPAVAAVLAGQADVMPLAATARASQGSSSGPCSEGRRSSPGARPGAT
jgi:hypothetical protein